MFIWEVFGKSKKVVCLSLSIIVSCLLIGAFISVIVGRSSYPIINCAKTSETQGCSFHVLSYLSAITVPLILLCALCQCVALLASLSYFFYRPYKGYVALFLFAEIMVVILSQTLWAYILVDIGSSQTRIEVYDGRFECSVACHRRSIIRPALACAFVFTLFAYIFSVSIRNVK